MVVFLILIALGAWILYNFATFFYDIPYLDICTSGNFLLESLHMISMRWCFPIGLIVLAVGILGVVFHKRDTNNFDKLKWGILALALFMSIALCF